MEAVYGIDSEGFETRLTPSKTFGAIMFHRHVEVAPSGTAAVSNAWHWASDVHLGHGSKEARKAIMAGRLVEATPRNKAGKAVQSLTTGALDESVIQQAQADEQAIESAFTEAGFSKA